jgi:hypothetical protein
MIFLLLIAAWDYSYDFGVAAAYDNNIYAYSDEYIDDFVNGVNAYRFPFETYDDLITTADLDLLFRNKFFGTRTTTFSFNLGMNHYLINREKDYAKFKFGIRQSLGKYAIKVSYRVIPRYLIRYYQNPQSTSTEYIGCKVTYHTLSGKLSLMTLADIRLHLAYSRRWDDYIEEFNRYDADGHIIAFGLEKKLSKYFDFAFGYNYRISNADSADVIASGTELTPDGSYHQHSLNADLIFQTVVILPTLFEGSYGYGYRSYTTSSATDSLHSGRRDHRHKITLTTHSRLLTGLQLKLLFLWQWRNATSEIYPDIDAIKDYEKYKVGAGLELYY